MHHQDDSGKKKPENPKKTDKEDLDIFNDKDKELQLDQDEEELSGVVQGQPEKEKNDLPEFGSESRPSRPVHQGFMAPAQKKGAPDSESTPQSPQGRKNEDIGKGQGSPFTKRK